jgi:hypothetical protein
MSVFTPYTAIRPTPQDINLKTIFLELQRGLLKYNEISCVVDGDTKIAHKLSALPTGWMLIDLQDANIVTRVSWDTTFITLTASSSTRCKILIY